MSEPTVDAEEAAVGEHDEHEHRSVWPVIGAAGAAGLYVGIALTVLSGSIELLPTAAGVVVAVGGALGLVAGLLGWTNEAFLADYLSERGASKPYRETMVIFLATDLATFAIGFVYYLHVRTLAWPPEELPHLLSPLLAANTLILLGSSVTVHYAHHYLEAGNRDRFVQLLGVTVLAGLVFLGGQVLEYYTFIVEEGLDLTDGVFASAFFGLTGLHGLHVALGVFLLGLVFYRALQGHYGPSRDTSVATVSLYWHFVDAVWIFLVAILYVGAEL